MRFEQAGQPPVVQRTTFESVTDDGCTYRTATLADDGTVVREDGPATATWRELSDHARFPSSRTARSESRVNTPAGEFDVWLYEVDSEQEGAPVQRFFFAKNLPGPPVLLEVEHNGQVVTRMVLVSHSRLTTAND